LWFNKYCDAKRYFNSTLGPEMPSFADGAHAFIYQGGTTGTGNPLAPFGCSAVFNSLAPEATCPDPGAAGPTKGESCLCDVCNIDPTTGAAYSFTKVVEPPSSLYYYEPGSPVIFC
jgi:hypothetical protein